MTEECKDLISNLLIKEPENRIGSDGGIDQILNHPWFSDIDVKKLLNFFIVVRLRQYKLGHTKIDHFK